MDASLAGAGSACGSVEVVTAGVVLGEMICCACEVRRAIRASIAAGSLGLGRESKGLLSGVVPALGSATGLAGAFVSADAFARSLLGSTGVPIVEAAEVEASEVD